MTRKNICACFGLLLCATLAGPLVAEAWELETDLDAGLFSKHIRRGRILSNRAVFQPAATVRSPLGWRAGVWGSLDLTDRNFRQGDWTQVDLTAGYTWTLPVPVDLETGYLEVHYPGSSRDAERELFVAVDAAHLLLTPGATVYVDLSDASALYMTFRIGHSLDVAEDLRLDLGLSAGVGTEAHNARHFSVSEAALNDVNLSAHLDYDLAEGLVLEAMAQYTRLPGRTLVTAKNQAILFGVGLRYRF